MALLPFSGTVGPIFRIRDVPSRIRIRTWFHPGSRSSHFSRKRGIGRIGTGALGAGATGIGAVPEIFFGKEPDPHRLHSGLSVTDPSSAF
jgi:hypothetical protein